MSAHQTLDAELGRAVEQIVTAVQPSRILLFGSHARGVGHINSDVDILVLLPSDSPHLKNRLQTIGKILGSIKKAPFSEHILLHSEEEFWTYRDSDIHVLGEAARHGRELYVRPSIN